MERAVDGLANAGVVAVNLGERGPVGGLVFRQAAHRRIDTELEQLVELGVEGRHRQRAAADQISVEGFQMAQVENIAMPFGDGAIVERIGSQQAEQLVGPPARAGKSFGQMRFTRHTKPDSSLPTQAAHDAVRRRGSLRGAASGFRAPAAEAAAAMT